MSRVLPYAATGNYALSGSRILSRHYPMAPQYTHRVQYTCTFILNIQPTGTGTMYECLPRNTNKHLMGLIALNQQNDFCNIFT